jgi:hypothetical protein
MKKFNYEKNREKISEYANIVIALEHYIKHCGSIGMDDEFIARHKKTYDKYDHKLKQCHEEEKVYFADIKIRLKLEEN